MPIPSPDEQLTFLDNLQRLLAEGQFTATYKFALLLALGDVSVELADDSGLPLRVQLEQLADKFIRAYWRQAVPYIAGSGTAMSGILRQNTGKQASLITWLEDLHHTHGHSLAKLKNDQKLWHELIHQTMDLIIAMPLGKLQTIGQQQLQFLYRGPAIHGAIDLLPGVAFCFRRFHGLLADLVHGAWLRFVRLLPVNQNILGQSQDLSEFLFGSDRADLSAYLPILRNFQTDCFYCLKPLSGGAHVDHFIPWARYPINLAHNFVLAHARCNQDKGDSLAAPVHLERWIARNTAYQKVLAVAFDGAGLLHDHGASLQIARWAYGTSAANVWLTGKEFVTPPSDWRRYFEKEHGPA